MQHESYHDSTRAVTTRYLWRISFASPVRLYQMNDATAVNKLNITSTHKHEHVHTASQTQSHK